MKLIAVRHGETEWNVAGREIGQLDSPLTALGRTQAEAIARRIATVKIDAIYASDLGRAMQTAEVISVACGVPVTPDAGLRERHMGIFQGLTADERRARFPGESASFDSLDPNYVIPGGESARQRNARSLKTFTAIAEQHPSQTVVAVTHSGLLRGFFESVVGIEHNDGSRFRRDNAAYNEFEYTGDRWVMVTWNDVSHLR